MRKSATMILIVFLMAVSMCLPAFAAISLEDYDDEMHSAVQQLIQDEIADDSVKEKELEILEAFYNAIYGDGDIKTQNSGAKVITSVAKSQNVKNTQWKSAYQQACEQYDVPTLMDNAGSEADAELASLAVSKLHILQWEADTTGVNNSAMKKMLEEILATPALNNIMGICMTLAAALCIAFGVGDIVDKATERNVSTDALWRAFLKMSIGLVVIFNCLYIAAALVFVGNVLLTAALDATNAATVANSSAYRTHMALWESFVAMEKAGGVSMTSSISGSGNSNAFSSAINAAREFIDGVSSYMVSGLSGAVAGGAAAGTLGGGIIGALGGILGTALTKLAGSGIMSFFISLTVYAIAIDIGVRFVFTPLAIADLFSERFRSTGVRWLKGLAAVSLQGVAVYVIVIVGTALRTTLEGGALIPGFAPVTGLVVNFTMIGLFAKSRSFAQEIIGTH